MATSPAELDFPLDAGFTGSSHSEMTGRQERAFRHHLAHWFDRHPNSRFRHGDCIKCDAQAHGIAVELDMFVIIHPPTDPKKRAFCTTGRHQVLPKQPYLMRNDALVANSHVMFATPQERGEVLRSGTWSTIRRAMDARRKLYVIFPDGVCEDWTAK